MKKSKFLALILGGLFWASSAQGAEVASQPSFNFSADVVLLGETFSVLEFGLRTAESAETFDKFYFFVKDENNLVASDFEKFEIFAESGANSGFQVGEDLLAGSTTNILLSPTQASIMLNTNNALSGTEKKFYLVATVSENAEIEHKFSFDVQEDSVETSVSSPNFNGYLDGSQTVIFETDSEPEVVSISSAEEDEIYTEGETVEIVITFSEEVDVSGDPEITLNSGGTAECETGTNVTEISCEYTIQEGENAEDLEVVELSGAVITDSNGNDLEEDLPESGSGNTLSESTDIEIDTESPVVSVSVSSAKIDSSNLTQVVTATYSEDVDTSANPQIIFTPSPNFTSAGDGSWISATEYRESFVHDGSAETSSTRAGIESATIKDLEGNLELVPEYSAEFSISFVVATTTSTSTNTTTSTSTSSSTKSRGGGSKIFHNILIWGDEGAVAMAPHKKNSSRESVKIFESCVKKNEAQKCLEAWAQENDLVIFESGMDLGLLVDADELHFSAPKIVESGDENTKTCAREKLNQISDKRGFDVERDEEMRFRDLSAAHPNFEAAAILGRRGIISGTEEAKVELDRPLSRAEAAKIVAVAAEAEVLTDASCGDWIFTDVPQSAWEYPYVEFLKSAKIVHGYDTGEFKPNQMISRAEATKVLVRAFLENENEKRMRGLEWGEQYLAKAKALGIVPEKISQPSAMDSSINRGDFFQMTLGLLQRKAEREGGEIVLD